MTTVQTFESFLARSRKDYFYFAKRLTRNAYDAEDLVQEASIRAVRALHSLTSEKIPDAWFKQIIKNCFLDSRRYKSRRPVTTSLEAIQESRPSFDLEDANAVLPFSLLGEEYSADVEQALAKLTSEQRALLMGTLHGLSGKELSAKFKCGAVTVRTRLHRAHRSLRRHLMESGAHNDYRMSPQANVA